MSPCAQSKAAPPSGSHISRKPTLGGEGALGIWLLIRLILDICAFVCCLRINFGVLILMESYWYIDSDGFNLILIFIHCFDNDCCIYLVVMCENDLVSYDFDVLN